MTATEDLYDLMNDELYDMFNGEMQLAKALPNICAHVTDPGLKQLIEEYREKNDEQIFQFKQAFYHLYQKRHERKCDSMEDMINEMMHIISSKIHSEERDARLVEILQLMIIFQMAGYKEVCEYADTLGFYDVSSFVRQTLADKQEIDHKLMKLAGHLLGEEQFVI